MVKGLVPTMQVTVRFQVGQQCNSTIILKVFPLATKQKLDWRDSKQRQENWVIKKRMYKTLTREVDLEEKAEVGFRGF